MTPARPHRRAGARRDRGRRPRRDRAVDRLPRPRGRRRPQLLHLGLRRRRARRPAASRSAIKDLFCTEGVPSQAGSRIIEDYRPPYTATSVRNLADGGAVLLAKTNQDEFAMGSSTENSAYGPTLNPWDRSRVPGGSSGGSAAAVAAGLVPWSIGTDTGGSIRQPAALCGIVGLKPTYGAVSRYGMIAFASSLDQCGPFTRDVTDAAVLLEAHAGRRRAWTRRRSGCRSRSRGPTAPGPQGRPPRRAGGALGRGDRARDPRALPGDARARAVARRDGGADAPAARAARARRVLPDRPGGVLVQPRPLRRRSLRPARSRATTCSTCTRARAPPASAPRSSAAS